MVFLRTLIFLLVVTGCTLADDPRDLTSLSLEDFLSVEVTSVDRSAQKLSRTAAAVFVITHEDIRRSGASTLPDVLRLAPGVNVARLASAVWAVSIRGFGNIYSNKTLVLIDGRTVYSPLFSGTKWSENLMMLEDIERIEIIRGPGATTWGANAVSGVISIITRNAHATQGGVAAASVGSFNPAGGRLRYGSDIGSGGAFRGWAQYGRYGQPAVDGLAALPTWDAERGGVRFDWNRGERNSFLVEGEAHRSGALFPMLTSNKLAPYNVSQIDHYGGALLWRWDRSGDDGSLTSTQAIYDDSVISGGYFNSHVRTLDFDFKRAFRRGRHSLSYGGGGRLNIIKTEGTKNLWFAPADANYGIVNAFLQDEWELRRDRLFLTLGAKLERYSKVGNSYQPTFRLMWTPNAHSGFWASASRAVRSPAHADFAMQIPIAHPTIPYPIQLESNSDIRPEVLYAFEGGARFQFKRRWAVDVAAFRHEYRMLHEYAVLPVSEDDLRRAWAGQPITLHARAVPASDGHLHGVEALVAYEAAKWWRISASLSSLAGTFSRRPGYADALAMVLPDQTPPYQGQIRSAWNIGRRWTADAAYFQYATLGELDGRSRVDLRVARTLGEFAEISVSGHDLLNAHTLEFLSPVLQSQGRVGRSVEATLIFRF